jgi:hypothetical protein
MEYMYLGWYAIVCGRNGEGYDSSSCTWSICILAGTLLCVGGIVRAMVAAPAHGVYVSWLISKNLLTLPENLTSTPIYNMNHVA